MTTLLRKLVGRILRRSVKKGLGDGSTLWMVIGVVAWFVRFLLKPDKPKISRTEVHPGETLIVTNVQPAARGRRGRSTSS